LPLAWVIEMPCASTIVPCDEIVLTIGLAASCILQILWRPAAIASIFAEPMNLIGGNLPAADGYVAKQTSR